MKKKPTNISASVLARLKNVADKEHLDFNFLLLRYIQERFLSRLAVSGYVNKFVLKGGFLLLAYNIVKARPTKDIDFLGVQVSSDRKNLERMIKEIASVDLNDGVKFLPDSIKSESITEDADYEGVRVKIPRESDPPGIPSRLILVLEISLARIRFKWTIQLYWTEKLSKSWPILRKQSSPRSSKQS